MMPELQKQQHNRQKMSTSAHNAPIYTLNNSKSNRSLYTENSQDSQMDHVKKNQPQIKNQQPSAKEEEPVSQKIGKLPSIIPQAVDRSGNRDGAARKSHDYGYKEMYDGIPQIPKGSSNNNRYRQQEQDDKNRSFQLGRPGGPQFNTIAVTSLDREQARNYLGEAINPMQMTGMSGTVPKNESDRSRMLRSSQGGRWFRSQSLMQEKGLPSQQPLNVTNVELMTRNFHRHQSKYVEQLQHYMKFYTTSQKQLQEKNDLFYKYKLNVGNTVEQIKNKMQNYLESKIDLSNLPIDRPDSDWGQQQLIKFYTNYQQILNHKLELPENAGKNEQDGQKIQTVLKKYKNCCYYGPVKDGKKHGFGYLHYFSGRFFEGLFENDQKIKGFEMDDAQLYLGQYDKNQRNGQGILKTNQYLLCGIFTAGEFKSDANGKFQSTGFSKKGPRNQLSSAVIRKGFKIQFSSVAFYMGTQIIIDKNNNGDIYIGQITHDGLKNGQGVQIFSNGDLYIGKYQQGAPEGYGEYYWDSGAFYRGDFLSGMRHGKGVWAMMHGDSYKGQYLNDKKNGRGVYLWKSGDRYEGQFENDYRHGYGEMYWRDGTSFKGQWLNGIEINKTFKIGNDAKQQRITESSSTKNNFKTIQARTRILKKQQIKSVSRNSKNSHPHTIQQTVSQPAKNPYLEKNKRIPLEKLKAMLNPSNSIN